MTVQAVLLVPPDGDPQGLLMGGPVGARPPMLTECRCDWNTTHRAIWRSPGSSVSSPADVCPEPDCRKWALHATGRQALVLAWKGKRLPAGIFTAWYQQDQALYLEEQDNGLADALDGSGMKRLADIVTTWRRVGEPLGTLISLNDDALEIP